MKNTKNRSFSVIAKRLIPITEFIPFPEQVAIAPEQLELCDLSSLPSNITLLTTLDSLEVQIRKDVVLEVELVRRIDDASPLAQKYGAKQVALTIVDATSMVPIDKEAASRLPNIRVSTWTRPNGASWQFSLANVTSGKGLLDAVQASDEFVMENAAGLLAERYPKTSDTSSQN